MVYRALAQGQFQRFGVAQAGGTVSGDNALINPYGIFVPAQRFALKIMRYMHEHGIRQEALRALALASYHHAQSNPRAVMYGRPLTEEAYDASRWISEPYHLFDCCQENDGAAALVMVAAERAKDFKNKPAYVLAVAQGIRPSQCGALVQRAGIRLRQLRAGRAASLGDGQARPERMSTCCKATRISPAAC